VKELLHELADEVAKAVGSFEGDAGAIMGTNAYGTPTQAIDRIAEEAVLRYLAYNDSDLNVLSEEAGFVDRGGKRTLVLDPIDGSYNAVRGVPLYTTSMAVGGDRLATVSHGLVRHLATGDTYYAEKGAGAFRNGKKVSARAFEAKDALFSVYLGSLAAAASYKVAKSARRVRSLGSASLDLCNVASGAFDLYYLNTTAEARLRVMDIAAGVLLVREAGGVVVDQTRKDLDMAIDLKARTNLVAAGDRRALEVLA
jgi:fructose-1,6-bisphosphatase/inositol monophosphatase family enzyme